MRPTLRAPGATAVCTGRRAAVISGNVVSVLNGRAANLGRAHPDDSRGGRSRPLAYLGWILISKERSSVRPAAVVI